MCRLCSGTTEGLLVLQHDFCALGQGSLSSWLAYSALVGLSRWLTRTTEVPFPGCCLESPPPDCSAHRDRHPGQSAAGALLPLGSGLAVPPSAAMGL